LNSQKPQTGKPDKPETADFCDLTTNTDSILGKYLSVTANLSSTKEGPIIWKNNCNIKSLELRFAKGSESEAGIKALIDAIQNLEGSEYVLSATVVGRVIKVPCTFNIQVGNCHAFEVSQASNLHSSKNSGQLYYKPLEFLRKYAYRRLVLN
jgi:hypothetical protein